MKANRTNRFIDSPKKQNNRIFKGQFHNCMRAVYEDKKIYAKNKCFTLVSPLPKKKGPAFLRSLCCWQLPLLGSNQGQ